MDQGRIDGKNQRAGAERDHDVNAQAEECKASDSCSSLIALARFSAQGRLARRTLLLLCVAGTVGRALNRLKGRDVRHTAS